MENFNEPWTVKQQRGGPAYIVDVTDQIVMCIFSLKIAARIVECVNSKARWDNQAQRNYVWDHLIRLDQYLGTDHETAAEIVDHAIDEIDGLRAFKRGVDQALNSGDGSYRP